MSHHIDFKALSVQDVLDLAALIEEDARERYLEFADQMAAHHTGPAADFFKKMAAIEKTHAERLGQRRRAMFGDAPFTADRSLVIDVEAPEYQEVRAFMSVGEALDVAYEAEVKAFDFYDGALAAAEGGELRELFEDLRAQERQHQEMIKGFKARLGDEPGFDPGDFVDEPRAQ